VRGDAFKYKEKNLEVLYTTRLWPLSSGWSPQHLKIEGLLECQTNIIIIDQGASGETGCKCYMGETQGPPDWTQWDCPELRVGFLHFKNIFEMGELTSSHFIQLRKPWVILIHVEFATSSWHYRQKILSIVSNSYRDLHWWVEFIWM
jgi:hypothetical protein